MDVLSHAKDNLRVINQKRLHQNLLSLKQMLIENGVSPVETAAYSLERFQKEDLDRQQQILDNISKFLKILALEPIREVPRKERRQLEISRLKKAMKEFNLKAMDSEVFELIGNEDVIEVYGSEGVQIYRNLTFCKICSYSLLDLSVNSWDELYEKPAPVVRAIHDLVGEVMTTATKTLPYNLESHIQREKFIYAKTLRTFLVTPRYISPLVDEETGERAGILSTYSAKVIAEGPESLRLDIL